MKPDQTQEITDLIRPEQIAGEHLGRHIAQIGCHAIGQNDIVLALDRYIREMVLGQARLVDGDGAVRILRMHSGKNGGITAPSVLTVLPPSKGLHDPSQRPGQTP